MTLAASITEPPPTATTRSASIAARRSAPARIAASPGSGSTSAKTRTAAGASRRRTSSGTPRASVSASVTSSTRAAAASRSAPSAPALKNVAGGTRNHCGGDWRRETTLTLSSSR